VGFHADTLNPSLLVRVLVFAAASLLGAHLLAEAGASNAQDAHPATPKSVEHPRTVIRDVAFSAAGDETMDLYYPGPAGPHPVIVFVHGGGWIRGDKSQGLPDYLAAQLARRNFVGVAVNYRLAGWNIAGQPVNAFPAAVDDVKTAIRYLKVHAAELDLRADEIVLAGVSAGGHLAALAGASAALHELEPANLPVDLAAVDSTVRAVIDVVGINDVDRWGENGFAREAVAAFLGCPRYTGGRLTCAAGAGRRASVGPYVTSLAPPAYFAYGAEDGVVAPDLQGLPLYWQWMLAKGQHNVEYDLVANQGHELDRRGINWKRLEQFIDGVLAGDVH
jgi:acetyl esterase/lipase